MHSAEDNEMNIAWHTMLNSVPCFLLVALISDAQPPTAAPGASAGAPPSVFPPVTSFYLETTFRNLKEDSPVLRLPHYRPLASGGNELDPDKSELLL